MGRRRKRTGGHHNKAQIADAEVDWIDPTLPAAERASLLQYKRKAERTLKKEEARLKKIAAAKAKCFSLSYYEITILTVAAICFLIKLVVQGMKEGAFRK